MIFEVITLFPQMIVDMTNVGVVGSAFKKGLLELKTANPRDFTSDVHRSVDDRPYGGGDGMVMLVGPLQKALDSLAVQDGMAKGSGDSLDSTQISKVIYLSPQGKLWNDSLAREYARSVGRLTMISGRYGGVDERFLELNNVEEVSIGDYVLSGGELAVGVLIDSISRHIPGVLGHEASSVEESLARGTLEAPQYTRPVEMSGKKVPDILLSGNHEKIQAWREMMSLLVTKRKRPDLFQQLQLSDHRLHELDRFEKDLHL